MDKISLVIPIASYSYFVHACLKNIFDTCGAPEKLDFIFLTSKDVPKHLQDAFEEERKTYNFRVVSAPFNVDGDHLQLLDWIVRYGDLTDWFIVQHCDLFWLCLNWLPNILDEIDPNLVVLCSHTSSPYGFRHSPTSPEKGISFIGDFFGVYNRLELYKRNLYFRWGTLGTEVKISQQLADAFEAGKIYNKETKEVPKLEKTWIDGTQIMAWELAVTYPQGVKTLNKTFLDFSFDYFHPWGFFRICSGTKREGDMLFCNAQYSTESLAYYSYMSSWCIERSEIESKVIPWAFAEEVAAKRMLDLSEIKKKGEWLKGYSKAKNVVGMDKMGLKKVILGQEHSIRQIRLL